MQLLRFKQGLVLDSEPQKSLLHQYFFVYPEQEPQKMMLLPQRQKNIEIMYTYLEKYTCTMNNAAASHLLYNDGATLNGYNALKGQCHEIVDPRFFSSNNPP
jgi:hypothetical protein